MKIVKISKEKFETIILILLFIAFIFAIADLKPTDFSNYPGSASWLSAIPLILIGILSGISDII